LQQVEAELERICATHVVPDVEADVDERRWHRPMERTEATARMVGRAQAIAHDLGFELPEASTGGASDANTTSAPGVPTLDGLGPVGGDAHAESEWLDVGSIVPRAVLLAGLIAGLAEEAP
jgi:glutamate carboxypeptidase